MTAPHAFIFRKTYLLEKSFLPLQGRCNRILFVNVFLPILTFFKTFFY